MNREPYLVLLNVKEGASLDEIRIAYQRLATPYHTGLKHGDGDGRGSHLLPPQLHHPVMRPRKSPFRGYLMRFTILPR